MSASLVWFRQDLRLEDNSALAAAIARGGVVVPVYVHAPSEEGAWAPGSASRWWLHHALDDLGSSLRECGSRLLLRTAETRSTADILFEIAAACGADAVYWNDRYEPAAAARDNRLEHSLRASGLQVHRFNSALLIEPEKVSNQSGRPYRVFTPFWNYYRRLTIPAPVEVDFEALAPPPVWPESDRGGASPELLSGTRPGEGLQGFWGKPKRSDILSRLRQFAQTSAADYPATRDFPGEDGTSRLSPALHFGQISPREAWHLLDGVEDVSVALQTGIMRQIVWREFAYHLLNHFPKSSLEPLRDEFSLFPWREDPATLRRWERGETGYPIVDAGMAQLRETGWMHNRVRMIAGSLLVKQLLGHWLGGARWFWDQLVDADLANNTFGWQWLAGCGADAAPYFRIFNPVLQGAKFDPEGQYVKRFLPQLAMIPPKFLHQPWALGELDLRGFGVTLGRDYPYPLVGHTEGRNRALAAFKEMKDNMGAGIVRG